MKRPRIGDIFKIPLSDGRNAFGQYILQSKMGPLIQVYEILSVDEVDLDEIINSKLLFQPVIVGLFAAIKNEIWSVVGNKAVILKEHPRFITTNWNEKTGEAGIWVIWNGESYSNIGPVLPNAVKRYEFLVIWPPQMITKRIETGKVPFPFGELIRDNKFTPFDNS